VAGNAEEEMAAGQAVTGVCMVLKAGFVLLFLISAAIARGRADYLVIADPLDYTIYNQYGQPISETEKYDFVPYSPFQIIDKNVTLGDQITRALKFVFQQRMYYLLIAEDGKFTGEKSKTGRQTFHNAEPIEDTVEVVGGGLAMVSGSGRTVEIAKGLRVVRVFRSGPRYYCAALRDRTTYGWSSLEPRSVWRKNERGVSAKTGVKDTGLSETLRQRILARLMSADELYTTSFSHFNSLTGDEKTVPQWRCEYSGSRMHCELAGPYKNGDQLSESTRYLVQDIQNMLIGTDYGVICKNGELIIEKRSRGD
jgi:hypothetical protein